MPSEAEKELLLRVAERIGDEKFFPKGFHNPYSLLSFTQDEARIISRVLREAAEGTAYEKAIRVLRVIRATLPHMEGSEMSTFYLLRDIDAVLPPPPATETTKTEEGGK